MTDIIVILLAIRTWKTATQEQQNRDPQGMYVRLQVVPNQKHTKHSTVDKNMRMVEVNMLVVIMIIIINNRVICKVSH